MHGRAAMQHLISIHFSWPQLGQALLQCGREGMLYFVFNSQVVAVLVAHNLELGEFVAQVGMMKPCGTLWLFRGSCHHLHVVQAKSSTTTAAKRTS